MAKKIEKESPPSLPKRYILATGLVVLIIAVVGYTLFRMQPPPTVDTLIQEVGARILLPAKEIPTIATVSDTKKLAGQPFFARAQNGDKVIIYAQSKKAVLYRPSTKQVIEVGPVNLNAEGVQAQSVTPTTVPAPDFKNLKVAIYNGTTISGLASKIERDLKTKYPGIHIVYRGNASKRTYTQTAVIDLNASHERDAAVLAADLHGEVQAFPDGEHKPVADILIITAQ